MDLFDLWWNYDQERQLDELRGKMERGQLEHDLAGFNPNGMKALVEENQQLKSRLGLLVRLLISKGVFTAKEYADLIAQARPRASDQRITATPVPGRP